MPRRIVPVVALDYEKAQVNKSLIRRSEITHFLWATDKHLTDLQGGRTRYRGWFTQGTNTDLQPDYQIKFRPVDRTINYLMWIILRGKSLATQILFCFESSVLNCGKIMICQKYQM